MTLLMEREVTTKVRPECGEAGEIWSVTFATSSSKLDDVSEDEQEFGLGDGPAMKVSVSMRAGTVRILRKRLGKREFSAYVDAAVERQVERDLLDEALMVNEAIAEPVSPEVEEEIAALFRDFLSAPELKEDR